MATYRVTADLLVEDVNSPEEAVSAVYKLFHAAFKYLTDRQTADEADQVDVEDIIAGEEVPADA